jgi:DNA-binding MarR family transcriptional regulator
MTLFLLGRHGKMVSMKTKSEVVAEIGRLVAAVSDLFDADVDAERDFMEQRLPARMRSQVRAMPKAGMHLLAVIGDELRAGGTVNVVGLAARSGQLKGTVSKQVQRLVDAGLVRRDPVPGNRKEIRLELTADGRRVVEVHRRMHDEMDAGLSEFLMRYTSDELAVVVKILGDLAGMQRHGVRLTDPPTDTDR